MQSASSKSATAAGFTLIELSIVLVIIGLIVGGILVGQDLIRAAEVRATISQIEKYNTAVNTFYGKFNALPGDMNNSTAMTFGFSAAIHNSSGGPGQGDGNGVLDGFNAPFSTTVGGLANQITDLSRASGETGVFWVDLSSETAGHLIDGSFSLATEGAVANALTSQLPLYLPAAKLGRGNYIYVTEINNSNFFGIENVASMFSPLDGNASMTVAQAYGIDKKIDDGYPTTGTVAAMVIGSGGVPAWAKGGPAGSYSSYIPLNSLFSGTPNTAADAPDATTCFDNSSAPSPYSISQNGGQGANCALIVRFQ